MPRDLFLINTERNWFSVLFFWKEFKDQGRKWALAKSDDALWASLMMLMPSRLGPAWNPPISQGSRW